MSPKDLDGEQPMNKYPLGMEFPVFYRDWIKTSLLCPSLGDRYGL